MVKTTSVGRLSTDPSEPGTAVTARHIVKRYGSKKSPVTALEGIDLEVKKGELFGIIGPDGAGKTTLFRVLTTLLLADEGSGTVDGLDLVAGYKEIRSRVGYMPGRFSLYQDLTVEENLHFFATIFHTSVKANYGLIKDIYSQIAPFKDRKAGKLSGGMKQKLALSCALIHRPAVLFLDEPTTGVDAVSRKEFWQMLGKIKQQGITILVSTPYMDEAGLCDRVALMQSGRIMTVDTPAGIIQSFGKKLLAVKGDNMLLLLNELKNHSDVEDAYPFGEYHHAVMKSPDERSLENFLRLAGQHVEWKEVAANIEDCFIALMKNG